MEHIPYIAFESAQIRMERSNRRMFILCILLTFLLVATNAGWFFYEKQFQTVESTEVSQKVDTGDGLVTVIGIGDANG